MNRPKSGYAQWRLAVLERDGYRCQKCGKSATKLIAHHIQSWDEFPELRYEVANGQTLCPSCHLGHHATGPRSPEQQEALRERLRQYRVVRYGDEHWTRQRPDLVVRGERHGRVRLTAAQVAEIRDRWRPRHVTQKMLAVEYGVSLPTINRICRGAYWA